MWPQTGMRAMIPIPFASHRPPEPLQWLGNPVALASACAPPLGVRATQSCIHYHCMEQEFCNSSSCPGEPGENFSLAKAAKKVRGREWRERRGAGLGLWCNQGNRVTPPLKGSSPFSRVRFAQKLLLGQGSYSSGRHHVLGEPQC